MKVKELENFQNKMGLKCCQSSGLNAPGTETPVSYLFLGGSLILMATARRDKRCFSPMLAVIPAPRSFESPTEVLFAKHATSYLLG